jgi:hypothetical protein
VKVHDVDFIKDLLHIRYDPSKVTPQQMLEEVRKQGFEGTIVAGKRATEKTE